VSTGSVEGKREVEVEVSEESGVVGSSSDSNSNGNNNKSDGSIVFRSLEMRKLKEFSFAELKAATRSFKSDALLGEGGFGKVYKGWLHEKTLTPTKAGSGIMVAIKKLNPESMQGLQEWQVPFSSTFSILSSLLFHYLQQSLASFHLNTNLGKL